VLETVPAGDPLFRRQLAVKARPGRGIAGVKLEHRLVRAQELVFLLAVQGPRPPDRAVHLLQHRGPDAVESGTERDVGLVLVKTVDVGQLPGRYLVVPGISRAKIREVGGLVGPLVAVEPRLQAGQVLAPVEGAVHEVAMALLRATEKLVEIRQVVGRDPRRLGDVPRDKADHEKGPPMQGPEPFPEGPGQDEEDGIDGQQVAFADVEVALNGKNPVDREKGEERGEGKESLKSAAEGAS